MECSSSPHQLPALCGRYDPNQDEREPHFHDIATRADKERTLRLFQFEEGIIQALLLRIESGLAGDILEMRINNKHQRVH